MKNRYPFLIFFLLVSLIDFSQLEVKAESKTIVVPDNFVSLFDAVGNASEGDIIFVKSGNYNGPINRTLIIDKSLSIIGEEKESTILNFTPPLVREIIFTQTFWHRDVSIIIEANNVIISNFTIDSAEEPYLNLVNGAIRVIGNYTTLSNNIESVDVFLRSSFNLVYGNTITEGDFEILSGIANIITNDKLFFSKFDPGMWEWKEYNVEVISNSITSDLIFNPEENVIQFFVEENNETTGFCRVTIPKELLDSESNWTILMDNTLVHPNISKDINTTYLYFMYKSNPSIVKIYGTNSIPEFPSWIILPFSVLVTLIMIFVRNKIQRKDLE